MSSESGSQKSARKSFQKAGQAADRTAAEYAASPILAQLEGLVGSYLDQPYSLPPEALAAIQAQGAAAAHEAARNYLRTAYTDLEAGPGLRSGAARGAEVEAASRIGTGIAKSNMEAIIESYLRRPGDIGAALATGSGALQTQFAGERDRINALLGIGSGFTGLAGTASPAAQLGSGVGKLLGSVAGGNIPGILGDAS
jgi:hypothetical protein